MENAFHLHALVGFVFIAFSVFAILHRKSSEINILASILFLCIAIWSGSFAIISLENISKQYLQIYIHFASIANFMISPLIGITILKFFQHKIVKTFWVKILPLILFAIVTYLQISGNLSSIKDFSSEKGQWNIVYNNQTIYIILSILYYSIVIGSFVYLKINSKVEINTVIRKTGNIIFWSGTISFLLGTLNLILSNTVLKNLPLLPDVFLIILVTGLAYAIHSYKLFLLNPESLSEIIVDTIPDALVIINNKKQVIKHNPAYKKLCDKVGKYPTEFILNSDTVIAKILSKDKVTNLRHLIADVNKENIPVLISTSRITSKHMQVQGLVCIIKSITDLAEAEEKIKTLNSELEKRVEERTLELQEKVETLKELSNQLIISKNQAEESTRLKSAFLANMSHEIRTPMNGIIGFANMLTIMKPDEKKRKKYLNLVISSAQRLLCIINDIIDISKIEARQMDVFNVNCSLQKIMSEIINFYQIEAKKNNNKIIPNFNLPKEVDFILTDEGKLVQILNNLISNAIKFTHNGEITISCSLQNHKLQFCVSDTGLGIDKEFQSNIFDRFWQVPREDIAKYSGTGLGLAICKSLVEIIGGDIWFTSKANEGSEFYFTIPFIKGEDHKIIKEDKKSFFKFDNIKCFIIEDDEINFMLLEEIMTKYNISFISAKDGNEAIEIINSNKTFDIVLLDIKLPGKDGYEVFKEIRKKHKTVPVIAQTAYAMEGDKEKILEAGFDDYIAKPLTKDKIESVFTKLLS